MSIFVPVILIGAMASAAWAMEDPARAAHASPHPGNPVYVVPHSTTSDTPGLGAYLIGAVADIGGSPTIALEGYLRALSDDPDNMDLRIRSFELAMMAGDVDNGVRLARSMPQIEQTTMSRLALMGALAHEGKVPEARKMAAEVAKVSPELLQFQLFAMYLDYAQGGKPAELVKRLDKQEMAQVMMGRREYHKARLWLKAGEPNKALAALRKAHASEPSSVGTTLLLGQVLARQGQPDVAAALFEEFRAQNPAVALLVPSGEEVMTGTVPPFASTLDDDLASVLGDFGLLIWAQGAIGPARQVLNLSLWLNPEDIYNRYYLAMLLEMGGDLGAAKQHYALLAEKTDIVPGVRLSAQIRLAEVRYREGETEAAWTSIRELARDNPEIPSLQRSATQLAFDRGAFGDAIAGYTRLLDGLGPDATPEARTELLFARGASYERNGEVEKATKDMQEALKLMPTNPQVLNYLGYMWVDNNTNIPQAFEMLQKAHLLAPQDGAITDSLGWAYYKQGDYSTAMVYLLRATEQEPESAEIYDHLGDAYAKLGRKQDARREWQRALELVEAGGEVPSADFTKQVQRKLK
ncbi:MAG: tetratricopeptide repeat protein [Alphaproteobacteria bacterium]|nr:MAG: tetratricopeptide repeat protein [Alphaproteobacteria bacterium]